MSVSFCLCLQDVRSHPESSAILEEFRKGFFQDPSFAKVWHNYGFDRHALQSMGVVCDGFGGDTMHMARMHDASRKYGGGYSLEGLSGDKRTVMTDDVRSYLEIASTSVSAAAGAASAAGGAVSSAGGSASAPGAARAPDNSAPQVKIGMKERFGVAKPKRDGTAGKVLTLPPMLELQLTAAPLPNATRYEWIHYAALDAQATWNLREALHWHLQRTPARMDTELGRRLSLCGQLPHGSGIARESATPTSYASKNPGT